MMVFGEFSSFPYQRTGQKAIVDLEKEWLCYFLITNGSFSESPVAFVDVC